MKDFLKNNGILILIIAVLLSLITAVVSLTFGGLVNPFANVANVLSTPFRNGIHAFVEWSEGVYSDAFEREQLEQELEALRLENAELRRQAREGEANSRENERLRDLLGLKNLRPDFQFQEATVTARGATNWSSTLTLNVGSAQDVAKGNCVVDRYGNLVGVVSSAGLNWSTVTTVVDVDLEMGALNARTDSAAIAEGDFALMEQGRLKLSFLPQGEQLLSGDTILTSGLQSGGTAEYPAGLVIGYVKAVRSDESGMSDYAILTPATRLDELEQVFVIKSFEMTE